MKIFSNKKESVLFAKNLKTLTDFTLTCIKYNVMPARISNYYRIESNMSSDDSNLNGSSILTSADLIVDLIPNRELKEEIKKSKINVTEINNEINIDIKNADQEDLDTINKILKKVNKRYIGLLQSAIAERKKNIEAISDAKPKSKGLAMAKRKLLKD